jgi:hypothetical protein
MPADNFFTYFTQATTDLLTKHSAVFNSMGLNLFKGFAIVLIVWYGLTVALGAASGGHVLRWDRFASLLMSIAFAYTMITYYSNPIPGIGISFHNLLTDQGAELANQIEQKSIEDITTTFAGIYDALEQPSGPSLFDIAQIIRYFGTIFMLSVAQFAVLGVITFGFIAAAVCVLVGPLFIPFVIVPHMEWLFWGWFKALIQYAFYPVIGNAFVYVYGEMMMHYFEANPGPYDGQKIAGMFIQIVFLCIAFVWGVLKVPALVSSIFSGRSGDYAFPGIGWWR